MREEYWEIEGRVFREEIEEIWNLENGDGQKEGGNWVTLKEILGYGGRVLSVTLWITWRYWSENG